MKLENKVVITGGGSGIGKACVDYFLEKKAKVVIWDKSIENISVALEVLSVQCDVSSEVEVEKALFQTIEQIGTPQIAINCAGIVSGKRMVSREGAQPLSDFSKIINVNLIGTFNVMRLLAKAMMDRKISEGEERGVFINTASIAAFDGQIGQMAYAASKGGIVAMTLPAAREMAQFAIRVNTIAPGLIETPMLQSMPEELQTHLRALTVYPKRLGKPEEFAALASHIVENELINGEVIRLDGAIRLPPK